MNSIRISDHRGKKHLSYKYNIENGIKVARWYKDDKGFWRYNCPNNKKEVDKLIEIIMSNKLNKKLYGEQRYNDLMMQYKEKSKNEKGFWQQAKQINYEDENLPWYYPDD